eukprot:Gb_07760 [translate_table: standard]
MSAFELWFTAACQSSSVWTALNLHLYGHLTSVCSLSPTGVVGSLRRRMSVYLSPLTRFKFARQMCVDFPFSTDEVGVLPRRRCRPAGPTAGRSSHPSTRSMLCSCVNVGLAPSTDEVR